MKKAIFYCLPVGAAGGAFLSLTGLVAPVTGLLLGCLYGLIFCLVARPRANTPGAGLLWGLAFAEVFWLAGPVAIGRLFVSASPGATMMLDTVRARFPGPVGYILFFGAPLGIVLGTVNRRPTPGRPGQAKFSLSRAVVVGGLAGVLGGGGFGLGVGVWYRYLLVVSGADDAHATLARAYLGLVLSARSGIVWITRRTCCVRSDCRRNLRHR